MTKIAATSFISAGLLAFGLAASPVLAGPSSALLSSDKGASLVEPVQAYQRNCGWMNNGWFYQHRGSHVACRPPHPGRGYVWHREGQRYGWYHTAQKRWHHTNW